MVESGRSICRSTPAALDPQLVVQFSNRRRLLLTEAAVWMPHIGQSALRPSFGHCSLSGGCPKADIVAYRPEQPRLGHSGHSRAMCATAGSSPIPDMLHPPDPSSFTLALIDQHEKGAEQASVSGIQQLLDSPLLVHSEGRWSAQKMGASGLDLRPTPEALRNDESGGTKKLILVFARGFLRERQ